MICPERGFASVWISALVGLMLLGAAGPMGASGSEWSTDRTGFCGTLDSVSVENGSLVLAPRNQSFHQSSWAGGQNDTAFFVSQSPVATTFNRSVNLCWTDPSGLSLDTMPQWNRVPTGLSGRGAYMTALDPVHRRVLVTGGMYWRAYGSPVYCNETWELDIDNGAWTRKADLPLALGGASLCYDRTDDIYIMYGGYRATADGVDYLRLNATLVYDPGNDTWTRRPDAPWPAWTVYAPAWWEERTGRMFIFASLDGQVLAYDPRKDLWDIPTTIPYGGRFGTSSAYVRQMGKFVVFGGDDGFDHQLNSTYLYDPVDNSWDERAPAPITRNFAPAEWASSRGRMVLHGGWWEHGGTMVYDDLWWYDPLNDEWSRGNSSGTDYSRGYIHWDDLNGRLLVFGYYETDTNISYMTYDDLPRFFGEGELESGTLRFPSSMDLTRLALDVAGQDIGNGTGVLVRLAADGNDSFWDFRGPSPGFSDFFSAPSNDIPPGLDGARSLRYRIVMRSGDGRTSPRLGEIAVLARSFPASGSYRSEVFDSGSPSPRLLGVRWNETAGDGQMVNVSFRSSGAASGVAGAGWSAVGNGQERFDFPVERYWQYMVKLLTTTSHSTPACTAFAFRFNRPPELSGVRVVPASGFTYDRFNFSVQGRDADGDAVSASLLIDGRELELAPAGNASGWTAYSLELELAEGAHSYSFRLSDGSDTARLPARGNYTGPQVARNDPPAAAFRIKGGGGHHVKEAVEFDASASTDCEGPVDSYIFDFGDGSPAQTGPEARVKHAYRAAGKYNVTLTVVDGNNVSSAPATQQVTISKEAGKTPGFGVAPAVLALCAVALLRILVAGRRPAAARGKA
jgi:hypothetical protein